VITDEEIREALASGDDHRSRRCAPVWSGRRRSSRPTSSTKGIVITGAAPCYALDHLLRQRPTFPVTPGTIRCRASRWHRGRFSTSSIFLKKVAIPA